MLGVEQGWVVSGSRATRGSPQHFKWTRKYSGKIWNL